MTYRSEIRYYAEDDGIWLHCFEGKDTHWEVNLGFSPTVAEVVDAWADHVVKGGHA